MKIKEFQINRYGPLPMIPRIQLGDFNLFFGNNEDGKTLTIDALVKMLLGREIREFEQINRVEENPVGFIILEEGKKEFKIPEQGDLTRLTDLSSSECRNIFIIRNSDLSIARESDFYTNVTDRLTGLRTEEISDIKRALQKLGKLTRADSGAQLSDTVEFNKIKSRFRDAGRLIEKIDDSERKIADEDFDKLEEKSAKLRLEKEKIVLQLDNLEDARRRENYEKGKEALTVLRASINELEKLEKFSEETRQKWRDKERDIESFGKEKEGLSRELKEYIDEHKQIKKELNEKERDFRVLEDRKKKLDDDIKPDLKTCEIKAGELKQLEEKAEFLNGIGKSSAVLLGLALVGYILHPSMLMSIIGVISLLVTGYSWYIQWDFSKEKGWLDGALVRNKLSLSKLELEAESVERIYSNIQKFEEEYSKKNYELQELRKKADNKESKIKELRDDKIPGGEKRIKDAKTEISSLKEDSKTSTLEEYSEKLKMRKDQEARIKEQSSILKNLFGDQRKGVDEDISFWQEKIKELEEFKDKATDINYDEKSVRDLQGKEKQLVGEIDGISKKMSHLLGEMEDIGRKVNEILSLDGEYLHCKTSRDLKEIKKRLSAFVSEIKDNMDTALKVMEIFEEIEASEKAKVSELFGEKSPISKHFEEITGGLYKEVNFNQDTGKIEVLRGFDGKVLEVEKLSGGAYDQLYLSIRLALGEKLLKEKRGFFLLDDPFIKADAERVKRQMEVLKKISNKGWQIIYFSAKDEIKNTLIDDIRAEKINYVEVQSITT